MLSYLIVFIGILFDLVSFLIIIKILLSWFPGQAYSNRFFIFVSDVTEPVLSLAKKVTPRTGMLDFSPMIALLILDLTKTLIIYLLSYL